MTAALPSKTTGKKTLLAMLATLVLAVVPAVVLPTLVCNPSNTTLDDYGVVPQFALLDHLGNQLTQAELAGQITIINTIFTRCESICPALSLKTQAIQDNTAQKGDRIKLLSFSVDPTYDTPERLAAYAKRFSADPARWRFVTGDQAAMRSLLEGTFMVSMKLQGKTASGAPDIAHNGRYLLIDGNLHIRGIYDSADNKQLDDLLRDAKRLAKHVRSP